MNLFQIPIRLAGQTAPTTPLANTFRDIAVTYENNLADSLTLIRRLVDLHLYGGLAIGGDNTKRYDMMVISLLVPTEPGTVSMNASQHQLLKDYLDLQKYQLIRDKTSPFFYVPAEELYQALLDVSHVVENYTSLKFITLKDFWKCRK